MSANVQLPPEGYPGFYEDFADKACHWGELEDSFSAFHPGGLGNIVVEAAEVELDIAA